MSIMSRLLDAVRRSKNLSSDSALAELIGITRQTVSQYRNGSAYPAEDRFIELCDLARLDAGAWLAAMSAERATGSTQARWMEAARKLGYAAALCLAVYTSIPQAVAGVGTTLHKVDSLYITYNRGWLTGWRDS